MAWVFPPSVLFRRMSKSFGFCLLAFEHDHGPARPAVGAAQRSDVAGYRWW